MTRPTREQQAAALEKDWAENPRWKGIKRGYTAADVVRLRGSLKIEHTLAQRGAEKLWNLVNNEPFVNALGALTGNQAVQQVRGLPGFVESVVLSTCNRVELYATHALPSGDHGHAVVAQRGAHER